MPQGIELWKVGLNAFLPLTSDLSSELQENKDSFTPGELLLLLLTLIPLFLALSSTSSPQVNKSVLSFHLLIQK